jgi:hypothetical protein
MELKDAVALVHFRELHLLPRVVFFIGAVFLVGAFFVKVFVLGFAGVGVMLAATTLNLIIDMLLCFGLYFAKKPECGIPWALLLQSILALALTIATLVLTFYFYRHGEMPPCLRPLPFRL